MVMGFLLLLRLSECGAHTDSSGSPPVEGTKAGISFEKFFLSTEIVQHNFLADKGLIIYQCDFALNFYAGGASIGIFKPILLPRQLFSAPLTICASAQSLSA